jgi:tetratricopeptide (TPR) repeat protein
MALYARFRCVRSDLRQHRIPPPPAPLERLHVLEQVESTAGLVLWRALMDVRLWASAPAERRTLFRAPSAEVRERFALARSETPELAPALGTFALLLQAPELMDAEQVADACAFVHAWASERGLLLTALLFAEAAAQVEPDSPARANLAARSARRVAEFDRAGTWHLRAYKLAVRVKDEREKVWALLGYGTMMEATGRYAEARRFFQKSARRAKGTGRRKEAGIAHHNLSNIAVETGKYRLAEVHVNTALSLYPHDYPRIPPLAHDFAFALLRQHHYSAALYLLERVVPLIQRPEERALVLSSLAWAAAGAGRLQRLGEAECTAVELVGIFPDFAAAVFLHLAEGWRLCSDWERADRYAEAARVAAEQRHEPHLAREATDLRERLRQRKGVECDLPPTPRARGVLRDLSNRLRDWKQAPD